MNEVWHPPSRLAPTWRISTYLSLAVWFGLLTGLAEVIILAGKILVENNRTFIGPHAAWMGPLTHIVWFVPVGLVLALVGYRWPKVLPPWRAAVILSFLGFCSVLLLVSWLHGLAVPVLAAGLAIRTARPLGQLPQRLGRLFCSLTRSGRENSPGSLETSFADGKGFDAGQLPTRRQVVVAAAVAVPALAAEAYGRQTWLHRRALARLPSPPLGAPNVLLVVLDTVRAASVSLCGYSRPTTPNMQRLAAEGVTFDRALAAAPWTTPSHATMFTGRFAHELTGNRKCDFLDGRYPTLAEVLAGRGYLTAGFVANVACCGWTTGLDRGFAAFEDFVVSPAEAILSTGLGHALVSQRALRRLVGHYDLFGRKKAEEVNRSFLSWLDGARGRPFFAFLNYLDAHLPYFPPSPFDTRFVTSARRSPELIRYNTRFGTPAKKGKMTAQQVRAELDAYEGCVAYLDHQVGLLVGELARRDLLNDTLLIVTADHGEHHSEHGLFGHGNSLYMQELHVPLLMRLPGAVPDARRVAEPVSLRDLPATVLDLARVGSGPFPGAPLTRMWRGGGRGEEPLFSDRSRVNCKDGRMYSVVVGQHHCIRHHDGREELYDWYADPAEVHDLAQSSVGRRCLPPLRAALDDHLKLSSFPQGDVS